MDEKVICVKSGQKLTVESLVDAVTGEGFLLIVSETQAWSVLAREFVTAEGVRFTTDEKKAKLSKDTLEYQIYLTIKEYRDQEIPWGIERGQIGEFGEVSYMLVKDIAGVINAKLGNNEFRGFGSNTIAKICRSLEMRYFRTGQGYAVILEDQDLLAAEAKFNPQTK